MRLLPRSPRGTWILAGVVWAVGCGVLWWGLPVRPRAVVTDPTSMWVGHFSANGCSYLSRTYREAPIIGQPTPPFGPCRVWDTATGQCLGEWMPNRGPFSAYLSADGRALVLSDPETHDILDLHSGKRSQLPAPVSDEAFFTADGRLLAYPTHGEVCDTIWWDLQAGSAVNRLVGVRVVGVAADGRWAGVEGTGLVSVREPVTGQVLSTFLSAARVSRAVFSPGGDYLVVDGTHVREVSTGRECLRLSIQGGGWWMWPPGTAEVVTVQPEYGFLKTVGHTSTRWDPATGRAIESLELNLPAYPIGYGGPKFPLRSRAALIGPIEEPRDVWPSWMRSLPLIGPRLPWKAFTWTAVDARSGQELWRAPLGGSDTASTSPDGTVMVVRGFDGMTNTFWDIPPRKPLSWFLAGSALIALPLAGMAWWRGKRLRRATAQNA